jgi:hypothetical protein
VIIAGVRVALCRVSPGAMCCRWAELATLVQLAGHLRTTAVPGGPVVLVVELGSAAAAERCCRLAADADPAAQVLLAVPDTPTTAPAQAITTAPPSATPPPDPAAWAAARREADTRSGWTVLVRPGAALVRHAGLIDNRGGLLVGLPPRVLRGGMCCAAAAWRAALLTLPAHPTPRAAGRRGGRVRVAVACPNTVIAVALVGLARRLDVAARVHTHHGVDHTEISAPAGISALLRATGGPAAQRAFTATLPPASHRGSGGPAVAGGANADRARAAAGHAITQVRAAFAVLGGPSPDNPRIPAELAAAGLLRLAHPELSLSELAARADPPTTKHALAGRIRRLLALAAAHRETGADAPGRHAG